MADTTPLERDVRAVYGAYVYLSSHDLSAASATSRLLHEGDSAFLLRRVREEIDELRGAVAGTHGHGGGRADIVLEASQALYWLILLAVAWGEDYDDLRPHELLSPSAQEPAAATGTDIWSEPATGPASERRRQMLRAGFSTVGQQCRQGGLDPTEAVRHDLAALRDRPYLAAYWASYDGAAGGN